MVVFACALKCLSICNFHPFGASSALFRLHYCYAAFTCTLYECFLGCAFHSILGFLCCREFLNFYSDKRQDSLDEGSGHRSTQKHGLTSIAQPEFDFMTPGFGWYKTLLALDVGVTGVGT